MKKPSYRLLEQQLNHERSVKLLHESAIAAMSEEMKAGDKALAELTALQKRLEDFHEILARKNAIIRALALGDLTEAEAAGLSDGE